MDRIDRMQRDPARRCGHPDEFGATCVFLRSAHSGYLTGQNIAVDVGASRGLFDQRSICRLSPHLARLSVGPVAAGFCFRDAGVVDGDLP